MTDQLPSLPLDNVVVADWDGVRSLFREGWTGIASDRVHVYHRSKLTEPRDAWIETTTFVDGAWVDTETLRFDLANRDPSVNRATASQRLIRIDGTEQPFVVLAADQMWAALSTGREPVVKVVAGGVPPDAVSLVTVKADELEGSERFGAH